MIYFTSDLHFHHNKIMQYSPAFRNYADTEQMQEALIALWNSIVTPDDIVYDLGDISMSANINKIVKTAQRLNGKHVFILGNHDHAMRRNQEKLVRETKEDGNPLFESIGEYKYLKTPEGEFALSHYPMYGWENQQHGSIMLHGHLHDYIANVRGKILNVGFDLHGTLLSVEDILKFTESLPVLPYRNENDMAMKALKETTEVAVRKELIGSHLNKINTNQSSLDEVTLDQLSNFKGLARLAALELTEGFKRNNSFYLSKESPSINLNDFTCIEVKFFLNEQLKTGVSFTFSEGDDASVKNMLYNRLRTLLPAEYEIEILLEW